MLLPWVPPCSRSPAAGTRRCTGTSTPAATSVCSWTARSTTPATRSCSRTGGSRCWQRPSAARGCSAAGCSTSSPRSGRAGCCRSTTRSSATWACGPPWRGWSTWPASTAGACSHWWTGRAPRCEPAAAGGAAGSAAQRPGDHLACGRLHAGQMVRGDERLGVDLVHVLGARGPGGEPGVLGGHLQPTDRGVVTGGIDQCGGDRLPGERGGGHVLRGEPGQGRLLRPGGRCVHPGVPALSVLGDLLLVQLAGGAAGHGDDLRTEQGEQDAVLVGGPHGAVRAQERGPGGLLAAEGHR